MKKETSVDQLLRQLEDDSITNDQKADILAMIIDIESEKPEADMVLIQECFDYLEVLKNSEEEIAERKERISYHLQRSYQKAADGSAPFKNLDFFKIQQHPPARKRRIRTIGVAAAVFVSILLLVATSLTVIARVNGYGNMWDWLSDHLNEIFHFNPGETKTVDGITVVRENDSKVYPNIESWLQEESWGIKYPSVLPDDVKIERIILSTRGEGEFSIAWVFNSPDVHFLAQNYDLSNFKITGDMEIVEANGYQFGILSTLEGGYQAFCTINDFAYVIECAERDTLLTLINHLKGIES